MKLYRWITALVLFAIAGYCGYQSIGMLSATPYCVFIMCLCCAIMVLVDGGKSKCDRSK